MKAKYRFESKIYPELKDYHKAESTKQAHYDCVRNGVCNGVDCVMCGLSSHCDPDKSNPARFERFKAYLKDMPPVHGKETEPRDHLKYEYRTGWQAVKISGPWECLHTIGHEEGRFKGIGTVTGSGDVYRRIHHDLAVEAHTPAEEATHIVLPKLLAPKKGTRREWYPQYTKIYEIAARNIEIIKTTITAKDLLIAGMEEEMEKMRGDLTIAQDLADSYRLTRYGVDALDKIREAHALDMDTIGELTERLDHAERKLDASVRRAVIKEINELADEVTA